MGWKQFVRTTQAAARKNERAALRRHRELQRNYQRQLKASQRQKASDEVAEFENYISLLVTLHADCGEFWDWRAIALTAPPVQPTRSSDREKQARAVLDAYQPGFLERALGGAKKTRSDLENAIRDAVNADEQSHHAALEQYRQAYARWEVNAQLSPRVLRFELEACRNALDNAGAFEEVRALKTSVLLETVSPQAATLLCRIEDEEIVPKEEIRLTAGGKISTRLIAAGKYWALFKDHVCSSAIRVARETLAVLPLPVVVVNMQLVRLDPSNGFVGPATILGIRFERDKFANLNFDSLNPSAALAHFSHRVKFKKSSGFQTIEPVADAPLTETSYDDEVAEPLAPHSALDLNRRIVVLDVDNPFDGDQAQDTVARILAERPSTERGLYEIIQSEWEVPDPATFRGWTDSLHEAGVFQYQDEVDASSRRRTQERDVVEPAESEAEVLDADEIATGDPESVFLAWIEEHLSERATANFKIKTLVNQLGHYRADRRLSLKAVQDLATVLADAGISLDPDPRVAARSPGIDARVKVFRSLTAKASGADAQRDVARSVALWRFLWGTGLKKLYLTPAIGRPRSDDVCVENVHELIRTVQADQRNLAVLETLVATGALEHWLNEAQGSAVLAEVASGIRADGDPLKADRWIREAVRQQRL